MRGVFLILFVCFLTSLYSQSDVQSNLKRLNDSIKKYTYTDPQKAIEFSLGVFDNQDYMVPSQSLVNVYYNTSRALQNSNLPAQAIQYLNRLSDWLFVMARWTQKQLKLTEKFWNPPQQGNPDESQ